MRHYSVAPLCVNDLMSVWVGKRGREREGEVSKAASGKKSQWFQSCYLLEANVS